MATYSREYLQSYRQNVHIIDMCNQIEKQILQKAFRNETRLLYMWNPSLYYPVGNGEFIKADKVVDMLKKRFPDSLVEYQEVKNIHGKVESGIVVDWS